MIFGSLLSVHMTTQAVHKPHLNNRCLGASFPPSIIHRTRATFIHVHGGTMNKRNIQRRSTNQRLITMCSLTRLAYRFHQEWPSKGCNAYNGIVSVMKGNNKNADSDATLIYIVINKCTHMNSIFVEHKFDSISYCMIYWPCCIVFPYFVLCRRERCRIDKMNKYLRIINKNMNLTTYFWKKMDMY